MFRKNKKPIKYEMDNIKIRPASLDEEYEIGLWTSSYPWIKMGYEVKEYEPKYSDINYVITINGFIAGYFMAYNDVNIKDNTIIPLYGKRLILYDFVVDNKAYTKYSKVLFDYLIMYAKHNGYFAVVFSKVEEYSKFTNFVNKNYKTHITDDKVYVLIDNPNITNQEKHLTIYEKDKIEIEHLYFLYDLNFDVLKTKCKLKLNESEEISIDRLTGVIKFPTNVKTNKDQVLLNNYTKTLVYLIVSMYDSNRIKDVVIEYDINNPNYYEADIDGLLFVSRKYLEIKDDLEYINMLIEKGYDRVASNGFDYCMNDRCFSDSYAIYKFKK